MATGIKELKLWQEAVTLAGEVVRVVRQSNRREIKGFSDQLMHTAVAVAATIADGYSRDAAAEQRRGYTDAKRALATLETQLAVARHAELITAPTHAQLASRVAAVARLLSGYITFVERQLAAERATAGAAAAGVAAAGVVAGGAAVGGAGSVAAAGASVPYVPGAEPAMGEPVPAS